MRDAWSMPPLSWLQTVLVSGLTAIRLAIIAVLVLFVLGPMLLDLAKVRRGSPAGRGGCGSTSMNTALCCSQSACACSVDRTIAPRNVAGVGARVERSPGRPSPAGVPGGRPPTAVVVLE